MEAFNPDRYKERQTQADREKITKDTEEFLANGGEIKILSSGVSSGVCDLPPKEIRDIKKRLGVNKVSF